MIRNLRQGKPVKTPSELQQLADDLVNCQATLKQMDKFHEIDTQQSIVELMNKLQPYLRNRWKKNAMKMKQSEDVYPGFDELVSFMREVADEATDPVYGRMSYKSNQDTRNSKKSSTATNFAANTSSYFSGTPWKPPPCILCKKDHRLSYCQVF